ncbi:hypothetical protein [Paenibacillus sp. Root444D2]|uniref:hypothetical protein n=1 Tax=Paenibacillus sp. Root444D2 TaxID=1736538 RepID=UPI00070B32C2|nr:hypothetical protein [Paenibacillus sp. Root444D2]KQX69217.1 hypothetical protein ASD40_01585 [Paenibacillus sp. Root444D2]
MAIGDLIFVRGHYLINKAIEFFDGEFSHVCVSLSDSNNKILEAQGMTRSRIVPFYFDDYEVVELNLTQEQKDLVLKVAIQLTNFGYDYLQIVGIAIQDILKFRKPYFMNSPNKLICSELTDLFLYGIGWLDDDIYLGDCTVNEFYRKVKSKLAEVISSESNN